jgi:hypothetical protein
MDWLEPAETVGAVFVGYTTTCAVSTAVRRLSLTLICRMYVPTVENVAVVLAAVGVANVTVPGPLLIVH